MRWPWNKPPAAVEQAYEQARSFLSSAFMPQRAEHCTCTWTWTGAGNDKIAPGQLIRQPDPACPAEHDGRQDPRQRMRGLRQ